MSRAVLNMKLILGLHGHGQSAHVFNRKLAYIVEACKDELEFVFLDAPLIMSPVDLPGAQALSGSHSKRESRQVPSKHSPRAWWTPPLEGEEIDAREVHASLVYLKDAIASKGPFNGVVGFDQGAALAVLLTGLLEYPNYHPLFHVIPQTPFEFCVCISGFIIPSTAFVPPRGITTPALVVTGLNDTTILPDWTREVESFFVEVRSEQHDGGHFVPRKEAWRKFFVDYFTTHALSQPETYAYIDSGYNSDASESFLILTSPVVNQGNRSPSPPAYSPLPSAYDTPVTAVEDDLIPLRRRAIFTLADDTPSSSGFSSGLPSMAASERSSPIISRQESRILPPEANAYDKPNVMRDHEISEPSCDSPSEQSHTLVEMSIPTAISFTAAATVLMFSARFLHRIDLIQWSSS